jgi:hypothetical protein
METKVNRGEIYRKVGVMGILSTVLDELSDNALLELFTVINRTMGDYLGN